MVSFDCDNKAKCCKRTFMPLAPAYARTIHKFQGLTAGPVDEGKIPNMHKVLIVDPDEKHFEGKALGLLYTAVSRATTLGDDDGLNSAIYFDGADFKPDRIRNLIQKVEGGGEYESAKKRRRWVQHLDRNMSASEPAIDALMKSQDAILNWTKIHCVITYDVLFRRINKYKVSKQLRKRKDHPL